MIAAVLRCIGVWLDIIIHKMGLASWQRVNFIEASWENFGYVIHIVDWCISFVVFHVLLMHSCSGDGNLRSAGP